MNTYRGNQCRSNRFFKLNCVAEKYIILKFLDKSSGKPHR